MSTKLSLTGTGAAYVRVSTDDQDTARQHASINAFLARHGVQIAAQYWFEDIGLPRDFDRVRPAFQQLLKRAEAGVIQWIVIDSLDRFGTKSAKRLFRYLGELEDAGCRLYDADDKEWTGDDDGTEIQAWVAGKTSTREQVQKSKNVSGGMAAGARRGDHQGGPPGLGLDLAVFEGDREVWRFVFEGRDVVGTVVRRGKERPKYRIRRLKVYPDGREPERADGKVALRTSKETQVLRRVPSKDPDKLRAVRELFDRYANQRVTFFDLAKWLNEEGARNSFGKEFQPHDIERMLADEAYVGQPTFNKRRNGRFYCIKGGVPTKLERGLGGVNTANAPEDIIRPDPKAYHPEAIVDRATWDRAQDKLRERREAAAGAKPRAPKNADMYFAGLLYCGGCGKRMTAKAEKGIYYCSTWEKHCIRKGPGGSPCERNAVEHSILEKYHGKYLADIGHRLDRLPGATRAAAGRLADKYREDRTGAEEQLIAGMDRVYDALLEERPEELAALAMEDNERNDYEPGDPVFRHGPAASGAAGGPEGVLSDFALASLDLYRDHLDPSAIEAALAPLRAEHERLFNAYADLPPAAPKAREMAGARLQELEAKMEGLRRAGEDASQAVEAACRQLHDLRAAVASALQALAAEAGEQALRRKAETLGKVLGPGGRIVVRFADTGKRGPGGPGNARTIPCEIDFSPADGPDKVYVLDGSGAGGAPANGRSRAYGSA
jgi:DNA invertase Pin-like site-specific DNA recombinase